MLSKLQPFKKSARLRSGLNPCSIFANALHRCGTWNEGLLLSANGVNNLKAVQSNAFKFNGTDNYVDSGIKVTGGTPFFFDGLYKPESFTSAAAIFSCGGTTAPQKGFYLRTSPTSGIMQVVVCDGSAYAVQTFTPSLPAIPINQWVRVSLAWNGLIGGTITIIINGTTYTATASKTWVGDSYHNLLIGSQTTALYRFNGVAAFADFNINNLGTSRIVLATGSGNKIYDVDFPVPAYTVLGTIDSNSWVKQDEYHYNIENGFNLVSGEYIPASRTNLGFDVLGNALQNPTVNGHNGAETKLQQVNDLSAYDQDLIWFDGSGVRKQLAFADIQQETDRTGCKVQTNSKTDLYFFDHDLNTAERVKIDKCLAGDPPTGTEWITNDDGQILTDSNGIYLYT